MNRTFKVGEKVYYSSYGADSELNPFSDYKGVILRRLKRKREDVGTFYTIRINGQRIHAHEDELIGAKI
jgi:hypothetical protein